MPDPPVLPSRYDLVMAALRGEELPSEDPATPFAMLRRPPRAPDVELPKDEYPGWFAKLMAGVEGATGIPIGPNPEHYQRGGEDLAGYSDLGELGSMLLGPLAAGTMAMRGPQTVRAGARRISNPIVAHHGSPANFDKFDLSYRGTGEGGAAFGEGAYLAQNPSVSGTYRKLAPRTAEITPEVREAVAALDNLGFDRPGEALSIMETDPNWMQTWDVNPARSPEEARAVAVITDWVTKHPRGHGYEVNIHARPEELLDWDKALSQQSPQVRERLAQLGVKPEPMSANMVPGRVSSGGWRAIPEGIDPSGAEIYQQFMHDVSGETSEALRNAGIPGHQFLDRNSRSGGAAQVEQDLYALRRQLEGSTNAHPADRSAIEQRIAAKEAELKTLPPATRNFVIYDDQLLDIRRKYGFATLAAAAEWVRQQGGTVEKRPGADQ